MKRYSIGQVIALMLALSGCGNSTTPQPSQPIVGPFVGDTSRLTQAQQEAIAQATIDFNRVVDGRPPICKKDPDTSFSDGGTSVYVCKYYRLTVMKHLFSLAGQPVVGYLYGPIIKFDEDNSISDVRFYTFDELPSAHWPTSLRNR